MSSIDVALQHESGARRGASSLLAAVLILLAHAAIALMTPLPGQFRKYALAAEHYLSGELPLERLLDFSPLYFHLSVAAERLLPSPEAFLHGLQIAATATAGGFLFGLLRRRFSLALAAGMTAVFAADRHVLVYERVLEPEAFLLFLLLAFLYFVDARSERGLSVTAVAGLFAGLSVATRPTFLPVFLLVPLSLWLRHRRRWLGRTLAFAVPLAAVLALLAARTAWITGGDPLAPVMNPGTVFFEGNNPLSRGTSAIYPPIVLELVRHAGEIPDSAHHFYRLVARTDAGRELSVAEVNAYWSGKARAFLRAEPGRFGGLLRDKLTRIFHGFRWHDIPIAWQYDRWLTVPTVSFALVATLALLGALFEVRRWRQSLLLYAAGGAQVAVMLAFYVSARQRLILVPIAIYFAASGVERMVELRRRGLVVAALAVLIILVLWVPDDLMRDEVYQRQGHVETDRLLQEIRAETRDEPLARHTELVVAAMAASPWWLDWLRPAYFPLAGGTLEERLADALEAKSHPPFAAIPADFDLAAVSIEAGRLAVAQELLEPLAELDAVVYRGGRQPSLPRVLLGRVHALRGEVGKARAELESALERSPGDPFALAELAALTGEPRYLEQLDAYWSRLDARYLLGQALLRHGRPREALDALTFVSDRLPGFREPRIYRAAALADLGRLDEAAGEYLDASRIRLEPVVAGPRIAELFRRWAAAHPDRPEVVFYAAQVLHQLGELGEALALLENLEPPAALREEVAEERRRIAEALGVDRPS